MHLESKDILAIVLMLIALPMGTIAACVSQRARGFMFYLLLVTAVIPDRLDVNFISRYYYYRGTTRGFEVSLVDVIGICLLVAALLIPRKGQKRFYWPASLLPLILYSFYCVGSVITSDPKIFGAFELTKVFRATLIFISAAYFVRSQKELRLVVWALITTIALEFLLSVKQRYIGGEHRVFGSVYHPNSLSMYLCMAGPVLAAAAFARWSLFLRLCCVMALGMAFINSVLTISRAGIPMFIFVVGATTVFCMKWSVDWKKIVVGCLLVLTITGLIYKSWDNLTSRYGEATLDEEKNSKGGRGHYFRLAGRVLGDKPFGVGLNNWSYAVSKWYGAMEGISYENYDKLNSGPEPDHVESFHYAPPAHNLGVLTIGELGIPGFILFVLVWCRWFWIGAAFLFKCADPDPMMRLGIGFFFSVCGVFLQSLTEWTYRQTPIILTFHILLGAMAGLNAYRLMRKKNPIPPVEDNNDEEEEVMDEWETVEDSR